VAGQALTISFYEANDHRLGRLVLMMLGQQTSSEHDTLRGEGGMKRNKYSAAP
jgi:hypothetical protein